PTNASISNELSCDEVSHARDAAIGRLAGKVREAVADAGEDLELGAAARTPIRRDEALGHVERDVLVELGMGHPDRRKLLGLARLDDAERARLRHRRLVAEESIV